jgi:hypothetical protein
VQRIEDKVTREHIERAQARAVEVAAMLAAAGDVGNKHEELVALRRFITGALKDNLTALFNQLELPVEFTPEGEITIKDVGQALSRLDPIEFRIDRSKDLRLIVDPVQPDFFSRVLEAVSGHECISFMARKRNQEGVESVIRLMDDPEATPRLEREMKQKAEATLWKGLAPETPARSA